MKTLNENKQTKKRVQFFNVDKEDSDDDEIDISLESDSGRTEQDLPILNPNLFSTPSPNPNVEDYVLVELSPPKSTVYFVGKIIKVEQDGECCITFLRLKTKDSE